MIEKEVIVMKNGECPKFYKVIGTDIYASYNGLRWFWYGSVDCC